MSDEDTRVEAILGRYWPAGPPVRLRDRILAAAEPRRSRRAFIGWASMAAMLLLSFGLYRATDRVARETVAILSEQRMVWTAEAEEVAQLLNGHGSGGRYIALALAADGPRTARLLRRDAPARLLRGMQ